MLESPPDVIFHMIEKELGIDANENESSLEEARDWHNNLQENPWKLAFSVTKNINSKKLIEEISAETRLFPYFNNNGKLTYATIHELYVTSDLDWILPEHDIIKYSASKTPLADIRTEVIVEYEYDHLYEKQMKSTVNSEHVLDTAEELFNESPVGTFSYSNAFFNLERNQSQTFKSKYIHDDFTAEMLQAFLLGWYANQHTVLKLTMPLKYLKVEIGDIIGIRDLIGGKKIFGEDYSLSKWLGTEYEVRNGQLILPFFMVISRHISSKDVQLELIQMHHMAPYAPEFGGDNVLPGNGECSDLNYNDCMWSQFCEWDTEANQCVAIEGDFDWFPDGWYGMNGFGCGWEGYDYGGWSHITQAWDQETFPRTGAVQPGFAGGAYAEGVSPIQQDLTAVVSMPEGTQTNNPYYNMNQDPNEQWWFKWDNITILTEDYDPSYGCRFGEKIWMSAIPVDLQSSDGWGNNTASWEVEGAVHGLLEEFWHSWPGGFDWLGGEQYNPLRFPRVHVVVRCRVSNTAEAPMDDNDPEDVVTYECCFLTAITPEMHGGVSHCGSTPCWSQSQLGYIPTSAGDSSWAHGSGPLILKRDMNWMGASGSQEGHKFYCEGAYCDVFTKWKIVSVKTGSNTWEEGQETMSNREECQTVYISIADLYRKFRDGYGGAHHPGEQPPGKYDWWVIARQPLPGGFAGLMEVVTPKYMVLEGTGLQDPEMDPIEGSYSNSELFGCPTIRPHCESKWCHDHDLGWAMTNNAFFNWGNIDIWYNPEDHGYEFDSDWEWNYFIGGTMFGSEYFAFNHPEMKSGEPTILKQEPYQNLRYNYLELMNEGPQAFYSIWTLDMFLTNRFDVHFDYDGDGEITPTLGHWGYASKEFSDEIISHRSIGSWTEMGGADSPGGFKFIDMITTKWCWIGCGINSMQFCVDHLPMHMEEGINLYGGTCEGGNWAGNYGRKMMERLFGKNKKARYQPPVASIEHIPEEFRGKATPKFRKQLSQGTRGKGKKKK